MGRYYWSKKTEADSLKKIQVWWLNKQGYFRNGYHGGSIKWTNSWSENISSISFFTYIEINDSSLQLIYTQTDSEGVKKDFDYKIPLTTTSCYFGGARYWFICPWYVNQIYCGRRVGVLYKIGDFFACRHCNNLTYNSRNLSGILKTVGKITSAPDLDRMKETLKRVHYAGKMTKKYINYQKKEHKFIHQLSIINKALYN